MSQVFEHTQRDHLVHINCVESQVSQSSQQTQVIDFKTMGTLQSLLQILFSIIESGLNMRPMKIEKFLKPLT